MMDLREFRETLLRLEHPEEVLHLADRYLQQMEEMGDDFILPRAHILVKPVLEYYAGDLEGWAKFVRGVRDRLPMKGRAYHAGVNEVFRTIENRRIQQWRRERITRAVETAIRKGVITDSRADKERYGRRCEQAWKTRRDNMLKVASKQTASGMLRTAERELLLQEFWLHIDEEIANGEVPKP